MGFTPHMLNSTLSSEELTEYKVYKVVRGNAYLNLSLRHEISLTDSVCTYLQETQLFSCDLLDELSVFSITKFLSV